jgi:hypothetical protein
MAKYPLESNKGSSIRVAMWKGMNKEEKVFHRTSHVSLTPRRRGNIQIMSTATMKPASENVFRWGQGSDRPELDVS